MRALKLAYAVGTRVPGCRYVQTLLLSHLHWLHDQFILTTWHQPSHLQILWCRPESEACNSDILNFRCKNNRCPAFVCWSDSMAVSHERPCKLSQARGLLHRQLESGCVPLSWHSGV